MDGLWFCFLQTWWRHAMEFSICAGNSPVPGEFPAQKPVTRSFAVFFDLRLNKRLSKLSCGWWFETQSRLLWRHRYDVWFADQRTFYKRPISPGRKSILHAKSTSVLAKRVFLCISELSHHWFRLWLGTFSVPSHYKNQRWCIVSRVPWNKLQWNANQNTKIFVKDIHLKISACSAVAILCRSQCDNTRDQIDSGWWFADVLGTHSFYVDYKPDMWTLCIDL